MKALIISLTLFFATAVFAEETKKSQFGELAESTIKSMYGVTGDSSYAIQVAEKSSEDVLVETWEVHLTNGAYVGSSSYEVEITQNPIGGEGEQVASIKIKYLGGN